MPYLTFFWSRSFGCINSDLSPRRLHFEALPKFANDPLNFFDFCDLLAAGCAAVQPTMHERAESYIPQPETSLAHNLINPISKPPSVHVLFIFTYMYACWPHFPSCLPSSKSQTKTARSRLIPSVSLIKSFIWFCYGMPGVHRRVCGCSLDLQKSIILVKKLRQCDT